jgi:ankyrin repeat protein
MIDIHRAIRTAIQAHDDDRVFSLLSDPRARQAMQQVEPNTGDTLLHDAVRQGGSVDVFQALISVGAPLDQQNDYQMTPLYLAVSQGNRAAVKKLLCANARPSIPTLNKRTSLDEAIAQAHIEIALDLIAAGAKNDRCLIEAVRLFDPKPALALISRGVDPNVQEERTQMRPIHYAAQGAPEEITKALIAAGATLNDYDANIRTPLHHAAIDGQEILTALLLEAGADPRLPDQQGRTPLSIAVARNQSKVVEALLASPLGRETIEQPNWAKITPLQIARLDGRADMVDLLLGAEQDQEQGR